MYSRKIGLNKKVNLCQLVVTFSLINLIVPCNCGYECMRNPCVHGICIDDINSPHNCFCRDGFTGYSCQINWDECSTSPCLNGATCIDGIASFNCTCPPNFAGTLCEYDLSECNSFLPCQNNGTCSFDPSLIIPSKNGSGFYCQCPHGFTGRECEEDVSICNSRGDVCLHGGSCIDGRGSLFVCSCAPGYTGPHCETDIDECSSNPCLNGGICVDGVNGVRCACPFGYTGAHCESQMSICRENPCLNGAFCLEEGGMPKCYCVPDYHDNLCQYQYNECLPHPKCLNGGTCIDGVGGFLCTCPPGFWGPTCECVKRGENESECWEYSGRSDNGTDGHTPVTEYTITYSPTSTFEYSDSIIITPTSTWEFLDLTTSLTPSFTESIDIISTILISTILSEPRIDSSYYTNVYEVESPGGLKSSLTVLESTDVIYESPYLSSSIYLEPTTPLESTIFLESSYFTQSLPMPDLSKSLEFSESIYESSTIDLSSDIFNQLTTSTNLLNTSLVYSSPTPLISSESDFYLDISSTLTAPIPTESVEETLFIDFSTKVIVPSETLVFTSPSVDFEYPISSELISPTTQLFSPTVSTSPTPYENSTLFTTQTTPINLDSDMPNTTPINEFSSKISNNLTTAQTTPSSVEGSTSFQNNITTTGENTEKTSTSIMTTEESSSFKTSKKYTSTEGTTSFFNFTNIATITTNAATSSTSTISDNLTNESSISTRNYVTLGNINNYTTESIIKSTTSGTELPTENSSSTKNIITFSTIGNFTTDSIIIRSTQGGDFNNLTKGYSTTADSRTLGSQNEPCEESPCQNNAQCVVNFGQINCLCELGTSGSLCETKINITKPYFSPLHNTPSYISYYSLPPLSQYFQLKLHVVVTNFSQISLVLFLGNEGRNEEQIESPIKSDNFCVNGDFFALSFLRGYFALTWNLGSGTQRVLTPSRVDERIQVHNVVAGRRGRVGWLKVDGMRNRSAASPGPFSHLNVNGEVFLGGSSNMETLPFDLPLHTGFQGCLFDFGFRVGRKMVLPKELRGRNVLNCYQNC